MDDYTKTELQEAGQAILSLLHKCKKIAEKLEPGKSQHTLRVNPKFCVNSKMQCK